MGHYKLRVNPAKYDKPDPHPKNHKSHLKSGTKNPNTIPLKPQPSFRDHRTYKDATNSIPKNQNQQYQNPSPSQNPPQPSYPNPIAPNQNLEPNPLNLVQEMSMKRIMSSRVLGEDTERIREQLNIGELDEEQYIWIKGKSNPELTEMLGRSAIGVANSPSSSMLILNHMLSEGVNSISIKPLGGLLHLLTFESMEDKKDFLESQWLQRWFLELRDVNNSSAAIWREAWLTIYGVPITAWSYDNFLDIGSIYGKVLSIDYSRMDYARVSVITDCFFMINNPILFTVDNKNFKVHISEETIPPMGNLSRNPSDKQKDPTPENLRNDRNLDLESDMDEDDQFKEDEQPLDESHEKPISRGTIHEQTIDLGNDDSYKLIVSPNKVVQEFSPTKVQKPPRYPSSSKVHLNFNSPVGSPININSLENLNLSPSGSLGHLASNLGRTPSPSKHEKRTYHPPSLLKPQDFPNHKSSPVTYKNKPKPVTPPKITKELLSPSKSHTQNPSILYNNPPIHLSNSCIPIAKASQNSSSHQPSSSNSTSTPSIPPGFEDFIPSPLKTQREQKRNRKIQKKKMRRQASLSAHKNKPLPS